MCPTPDPLVAVVMFTVGATVLGVLCGCIMAVPVIATIKFLERVFR